MIPASECLKCILFTALMLTVWTFCAVKLESVEKRNFIERRV